MHNWQPWLQQQIAPALSLSAATDAASDPDLYFNNPLTAHLNRCAELVATLQQTHHAHMHVGRALHCAFSLRFATRTSHTVHRSMRHTACSHQQRHAAHAACSVAEPRLPSAAQLYSLLLYHTIAAPLIYTCSQHPTS